MRHIKDVHEGVKRAKCEVCGQAFVSNTVSLFHKFEYMTLIENLSFPKFKNLKFLLQQILDEVTVWIIMNIILHKYI